MDKKIKIGLICLFIGTIIILGSFIWNKQIPETKIIDNEKSCEKDLDCQWVCGCGCINKNAKCEVPEDIMYDCYPGMDEDYSCICKDNQCETIKK